MKRSKKMSYGLAIGLGAMALLVDRFSGWRVTSGTAAAMAAATASARSSVKNPSVAEPEESHSWSRTMIVRTPFPTRLPDYDPERDHRDVFALTPAIRDAVLRRPPEPPGVGDASKSGPEKENLKAADFRQLHSLSGVMLEGEGGYAILGGKWIQVGKSLDGCTLTRLEGDRAYFQCLDGEAELSVDSEETTVK